MLLTPKAALHRPRSPVRRAGYEEGDAGLLGAIAYDRGLL